MASPIFRNLRMRRHLTFISRGFSSKPATVESGRYSRDSILRSEFIYGKGYQGPGGNSSTEKFSARLGLKPGMIGLDIGCAAGGACFHMAKEYGMNTVGVDIQPAFMDICRERVAEVPDIAHRMKFKLGSVDNDDLFLEKSFDLVWSRDMLLYIEYANKHKVFSNLCRWLKPSGQLLITDYGMGPKPTASYLDYVSKTGQHQDTLEGYADRLRQAGFNLSVSEDITPEFKELYNADLARFRARKEEFIAAWGPEHFDSLDQRWEQKIAAQNDGSMRWFLFIGSRGDAA